MESNNYCFSPRCQQPHDDQVLSPPLTPALSPYKRDLNYRRASANDYHHSYWINPPSQQQQQQQQQQQRAMSFSDETIASRKRSMKQNKHACNYPRCGWSFKRFEHLKRHMLVHSGERPHACPFPGCGKRFSRTDNFHAHYRTHQKKALQKNSDEFIHPPLPPSAPGNSMNPENSDTIQTPQPRTSSPFRSILTTEQQPSSHFHHQYQQQHHTQYSQQHQPHDMHQQHPNPSHHHLHHHQQPPPHHHLHLHHSHPPPPSPHHQQQQQPHALPSRSSYGGDDKQHVCSHHQCQRRFKRLEHLKRHMRIHTLERPFQCTFPGCQKAFSRSDNLTQHSKTHTRSSDNRGSRTSPVTSPTTATSSSSPPLSASSSSSPPSSYSPNRLQHPEMGYNDFARPAFSNPKNRQEAPSSLHPMLHWQQHTGDATTGSIKC